MRKFILAWLFAAALTVPGAALAQSNDRNAPSPPDTLAGWAKGAELFDGLGNFHRKIATRSPSPRNILTRECGSSGRSTMTRRHGPSRKRQDRSPLRQLLLGRRPTLGPNYNMPMMSSPRARVGWQAVRKAEANARRATPVERALIAAVARRYRGAGEVDPSNSKPLLTAYVDAMRRVAARYPGDLDVQTMYAEALMNTNPWKLWKDDGTANPGTRKSWQRFDECSTRIPKHPGANHYYIHALEASQHPELAVKSAEALEGMMPAAGHLEHMPAHILQRVGRYEEAAEANRKGAAADLAYLKETSAPDYYPMYLIHNFQFLASAGGMEGRRAEDDYGAQGRASAHSGPAAVLHARLRLERELHLRWLHQVRHVG